MGLVPAEDPWVPEQAYAEDAIAALAYAVGSLEKRDPTEAAWAAQRAYESADHYVINHLHVDTERAVLAHPIVQAELARQRQDLDELLENPSDRRQRIDVLRSRAKANAGLGFVEELGQS